MGFKRVSKNFRGVQGVSKRCMGLSRASAVFGEVWIWSLEVLRFKTGFRDASDKF